jgi:hypothetical protein
MLMPGLQLNIGLAIGLVLFLVTILTIHFVMKNIKIRALRGIERERVLVEVERLRAGGEFDDSLVRGLTRDQRAFFEVVLIEALTTGSREDRHRLRAMLIKHGVDELCARRIMKESHSDRIRASTLLYLLRPQYRAADLDWEELGRTGEMAAGMEQADKALPGIAQEDHAKSHSSDL